MHTKKYKENELLGPGKEWQYNACVGHNGGPYGYNDLAYGYFFAGKKLTDSVLDDTYNLDVLIYPIIYVFRHAIELSLKYFSIELARIFSEKNGAKFNHNLLDNWTIVKKYLVMIKEFDSGCGLIVEIEKILINFNEIDAKGEVFRFPESKGGDYYLKDINLINIKEFYKKMERVSEVFSYWSYVIDDIKTKL